VLPLLAAVVLFLAGKPLWAGFVATAGLALLLAGLLVPALASAVERATRAVSLAAGVALTHLLLVPMYWLVFGLGHLALALLRKDPLARRFPTAEPTYWRPKRAATRPDRHRQQF
jgi:type IV secretory pathway TrbD component